VARLEVIRVALSSPDAKVADDCVSRLRQFLRRVVSRAEGHDTLSEALESAGTVREEGVEKLSHEEAPHAADVLLTAGWCGDRRHGRLRQWLILIRIPVVARPPVLPVPLLPFLNPEAQSVLLRATWTHSKKEERLEYDVAEPLKRHAIRVV